MEARGLSTSIPRAHPSSEAILVNNCACRSSGELPDDGFLKCDWRYDPMKPNQQGHRGCWSMSLHFSSQCNRIWAMQSGEWARGYLVAKGTAGALEQREAAIGCHPRTFSQLIISITHSLFINTRNQVFFWLPFCPFRLRQYYAVLTFSLCRIKCTWHSKESCCHGRHCEHWPGTAQHKRWPFKGTAFSSSSNLIKTVNPQRRETNSHVIWGRRGLTTL